MKPRKTVVFSYQLLSNIGCEIIVRGTVAFLTQAFRDYDLTFIVSSYHVERDRAILNDMPNVKIVPMLGWKRIARGLLMKSGLNKRFWTPRFATRHFRKADLFVSIGGDIYTMFGDKPPEDWLGYERFATAHGIPSMMFGANMERFEILSQADRARLLAHLRRFWLLAVRDAATRDYLAHYGITENVEVFPDPIFTLRPQTTFRTGRVETIGFNISPYVVNKYGNAEIGRLAAMAAALVERGYKLRLIPHVYATDGNPMIDDRVALRALYAALPEVTRLQVDLYDGPMSLRDMAREIGKVDLFIGVRMHACLNAVTLGKPTFFLGYSAKAETMVSWLTDHGPFTPVSASIATAMVPAVSLEKLLIFIAKQERAERRETRIDTAKFLSEAAIWQKIATADLFGEKMH